jgi:hypothetical protein
MYAYIFYIFSGSVLGQGQQKEQDKYQALQHGSSYCIKETKSSLY